MKNIINIKIKYISILIGISGLIPFGFPLIENVSENFFLNIEVIKFTIWYGIIILSFLSGTYWGLSLSFFIKKNKNLFYILPILSLIPFFMAFSAILVPNFTNIIFLILGFSICQVLDEILYYLKYIYSWYILLRRFLTLVVVTILIYYYINFSNE